MPEEGGSSPQVVKRTRARSGQLDYSVPVVIRSSPEASIELVRFYIPRTKGENFSVKILRWIKRGGLKVGLVPVDVISLNEPEVRKLRDALDEGLAVTGVRQEGRFLVLRLEGETEIVGQDPGQVAQALIRVLGQPDIAKALERVELDAELLAIMRGAVHLRDHRLAVDELRRMLDEEVVEERAYQEWLQRHSWAFGSVYSVPDEVRSIALGDQVDILLPLTLNGLRDLAELKRPDHPVLAWDETHRSFYFSSQASKAIGQTHRYLDALHESAQHGLRDHPEIQAYHPRAVIVIGRSDDWPEEKLRALHGLNDRLHGISLITYDQLLSLGERALAVVEGSGQPRE